MGVLFASSLLGWLDCVYSCENSSRNRTRMSLRSSAYSGLLVMHNMCSIMIFLHTRSPESGEFSDSGRTTH
uniref:Putative secreted protein n=1 Tax=Anopheles triannulatus TaxID=58253 RepID=A0A2M4B7T9_9DIPT